MLRLAVLQEPIRRATIDGMILRLAAFTDVPGGGNPAGVVLDARALDAAQMQAIAADVGYSETAFLTAQEGRAYDVRYFSPEAEVPFCGHATIATAVALAERDGPGNVLLRRGRTGPVQIAAIDDGGVIATLTSVDPTVSDVAASDVDAALAALGWARTDLDPALPLRIAYAGAHHLVLAAATRSTSPTCPTTSTSSRPACRHATSRPSTSCGARTRRPSTRATRSRSAGRRGPRDGRGRRGLRRLPARARRDHAAGAPHRAPGRRHDHPSLLSSISIRASAACGSPGAPWRCERQVVPPGSRSTCRSRRPARPASTPRPHARSRRAPDARPAPTARVTNTSTASACSAKETSMTAAG